MSYSFHYYIVSHCVSIPHVILLSIDIWFLSSFLDIINNATISISIQVFWYIWIKVYLGGELLGHETCLSSNLSDNAKLLSKYFYKLYFYHFLTWLVLYIKYDYKNPPPHVLYYICYLKNFKPFLWLWFSYLLGFYKCSKNKFEDSVGIHSCCVQGSISIHMYPAWAVIKHTNMTVDWLIFQFLKLVY